MYNLFLDGLQFPVAPSSLNTRINNMNKTITLMDYGEVNMLKRTGLTDFEFELLLPNSKYPFAVYPNGFQSASFYLEKLEALKFARQPFRFIVNRMKPKGSLLFDTNILVSLEEYEIQEDAENGFDCIVSIKLKQYRSYGTKKVVIQSSMSDDKKQVTKQPTRPTDDKKTPKTHKVVKGDTLWAICKRYLGNGNKYPEIAKLNGIKNPHLIYPGQVIKLG
ncbi:MAG: LysM domain-containing protein [Lysinibacillus sp.]